MLRIIGPSSNSIGKPSHIKENSQKKHVCNLVSYNARGLFNTNEIKKQKQIDDEVFTMNMCAFNARSLRNKIEETWKFLSENTIHLLAVSESWFGKSVPDSSVTIPGFQAPFRKDRNERGGGVCLYVSNNIPCRRRTDLERPDLELVWIEIFYEKTSFLAGCCYRPPASTSAFYNLLESSLESASPSKIVLLGDFNAKHSDWFDGDLTNRHGTTLKDLMDSLDLQQLCSSATHMDKTGTAVSLIDLVFTNTPSDVCQISVASPIGSSDHLPVIVKMSLGLAINNSSQGCKATKYWLFNAKDHVEMAKSFHPKDWQFVLSEDVTDINQLWSKWRKQFFHEVEKFVPTSPRRPSSKRFPPWFTTHVRRLITTKNRLYRRAVRSRLPEHWEVYCSVRNKCNKSVRLAKSAHLKAQGEILADANCPPSKWWQVARNLCGFSRATNDSQIPPLRSSNGNFAAVDLEKAELLNEVYVNQNTSLSTDSFPLGPTRVESKFNLTIVSSLDVGKVVHSLPAKTSSGKDNISYRLLKEAGNGVIAPLTALFNHSFRLAQVPNEWKMAIVTPVFKGGQKDRTQPSNYRPIALTSCVARVMEKLVNAQLLKYLLTNNLIYTHQSGFLPRHSTVTQLAFLVNKWQLALDKGLCIESAFLDLSKAYDRVSIAGLMFKLSNCGVSSHALRWFDSFLLNRTQCVRLNGICSSWRCLKSGIPQGTVLGPSLFLVFINDLPEKLSNDCSIFADDTTVYAIGENPRSTCETLSSDLALASEWAEEWGMSFSAEKSEHLRVLNRTDRLEETEPRVEMKDTPVPITKSHRHLGLVINRQLSWKDHINTIYTSCAPKVGMLNRLGHYLKRDTLSLIYRGYIRPRLEYACAIWSGDNTVKLQKLQERFCRRHQVHMSPLDTRFKYHTLVLFFKIKAKMSPSYLSSSLPKSINQSTTYNLRKTIYPVPLVNRKSSLTSFYPRALILWNSLPVFVQEATSLNSFKSRLKAHFNM